MPGDVGCVMVCVTVGGTDNGDPLGGFAQGLDAAGFSPDLERGDEGWNRVMAGAAGFPVPQEGR